MDAATERPYTGAFSAFLAGLQAGMLGVLWMLAWMGTSSAWQGRSFWTPENLMASAFHPHSAIRGIFAASSLSGLALYLVLYSLLGALFASAIRDRLPRLRAVLAGAVFGLCWYYLTFQLLWKNLLPLVASLHVEHSTILGHLLYGAILGRFPVYLPATHPLVASVAEPETVPAEPVSGETQAEGPGQ